MSTQSAILADAPTCTAAPATVTTAPVAARRLTRRERTLRHWNRMAVLFLVLILMYVVGCLAFIPATADQPSLPAVFAGFALAPLLGLAVAYWVTRMELTRLKRPAKVKAPVIRPRTIRAGGTAHCALTGRFLPMFRIQRAVPRPVGV
jgi:hypothetical protein